MGVIPASGQHDCGLPSYPGSQLLQGIELGHTPGPPWSTTIVSGPAPSKASYIGMCFPLAQEGAMRSSSSVTPSSIASASFPVAFLIIALCSWVSSIRTCSLLLDMRPPTGLG